MGRVVFYTASDLSTTGHLQDAEPILRGFDTGKPHDEVNEVLEMYNIQLYFEVGCALRTWTDDDENTFKETVKTFKPFIVAYVNGLNDDNFTAEYEQVEEALKSSFWKVFAMYRAYERVSPEQIEYVLKKESGVIDMLLEHQVIVKAYDKVLGDYMRGNRDCIELLLSAFLLQLDNPDKKPYIPSSLTLKDRDELITAFVDSSTPNISLLRIIEQAKDSNDLQISAGNRLKAKRKAENQYGQMMEKAIRFPYSISIELQNSPKDWAVRLMTGVNNDYKLCYNERLLKEYDDERLITMFADHYEYIDKTMQLTMPFNYVTDMVLLEFLSGYHGKRDYPITSAFNFKQQMAVMQMSFHRQYLKGRGKRLEDLLVWFYEESLKNKYGYPSGKMRLAAEGVTVVEKIRTLIPEIEAVLKRYDLYANEGRVDEGLLGYYKGVHFTETKSVLAKKYAYGVDGSRDVFLPIRLLFQPGAVMDRLPDGFDGERNLFNTIRHCRVKYDDYREWQRENLDYLIDQGLIGKDENDVLKLVNEARVAVLYDIHHDRAISYWTHPKVVQDEIDVMLGQGLLYTEDKLFSKPEQEYLNFLLNDKQFTNGPAIRNAYAHGDTPNVAEEAHEAAYNYLLIVLVCVLLKIQSELMIRG